MNVSIKPLLISASSPQMASLIYPFPRILAVHLKYSAANTSWKQPPIAKGIWFFLLLYLTLLPGHIYLITCPLRWPDMIMITTQACLEKPEHATALFGRTSSFFSASFWLQLAMRANTDAAVHWHHCREGFSYSALFSKGFYCCWKG